LDALSATVEQGGYSLLISTARGDAKTYELLMRRFLERRVDGLFFRSRTRSEPLGPL
jgi:DNA-binding LacI/PurR family transcriptional regulator